MLSNAPASCFRTKATLSRKEKRHLSEIREFVQNTVKKKKVKNGAKKKKTTSLCLIDM